MKRTFMVGLAAALSATSPASAQRSDVLRVVALDVEGGGGTLYVTPEGKSLLVDAGWPVGAGLPADASSGPTSADRIAAAARKLGLKRIDYLLVTHYHADHVGGVDNLLKSFPVDTLIDHGDNLEPPENRDGGGRLYASYLTSIAGHKRIKVKAGDTLSIGSMRIDITNAGAQVTKMRLAGAGNAVASCPATPVDRSITSENDASIGFVATFGTARILLLGDTTAKVEQQLVCPTNRIGPVDLLVVSHHGSAQSSSAALIDAVRPRVALLGNGARKGGDAQVLQTLAAAPSKPAVWQLHGATRSPELNVAEARIANPAGIPDAMHGLTATIARDGTITVENGRNGQKADYRR